MKQAGKLVAIAVLSGLPILCNGQSPGKRAANFTDEALARYAELTDTTILRAPGLPLLAISVTSDLSAETNAAVTTLKSALLAQGIEMLPHRDLFTLAVPPGWTNTPPAAQLAQIPANDLERTPWPAAGPTSEIMAPGMIDFINAECNQVLLLYAELAGKTLLRSGNLPNFQLKLKTQTSLSKSAAVYALRVMFALQGLAVAPDSEKFEQILPFKLAAEFVPRTPKSDPAEAVLAPNQIRDFRRSTATELLDYYAQLTDRAAVKESEREPSQKMIFKATTPLTKSEVLYALRAILGLEGLAIVQVDDKTIRLGLLDEAGALK